MQPHQQRVIDEKAELDGRLARLNTFIDGPIFGSVNDAERLRLIRQADLMRQLSAVLGERIAAFSEFGANCAIPPKEEQDSINTKHRNRLDIIGRHPDATVIGKHPDITMSLLLDKPLPVGTELYSAIQMMPIFNTPPMTEEQLLELMKPGPIWIGIDYSGDALRDARNDGIERAAQLVDQRFDEQEPWICGDDVRALKEPPPPLQEWVSGKTCGI